METGWTWGSEEDVEGRLLVRKDEYKDWDCAVEDIVEWDKEPNEPETRLKPGAVLVTPILITGADEIGLVSEL